MPQLKNNVQEQERQNMNCEGGGGGGREDDYELPQPLGGIYTKRSLSALQILCGAP